MTSAENSGDFGSGVVEVTLMPTVDNPTTIAENETVTNAMIQGFADDGIGGLTSDAVLSGISTPPHPPREDAPSPARQFSW